MLTAGLLLMAGLSAAQEPGHFEKVQFNRDIRPLLSDRCFTCHGPDGKKNESGLRLDTKEGAFADLGGYYALVPGKPEESEVYKRITSSDAEEFMPKPASGKTLSAGEIGLIRRWIEQGAEWQGHWAFVPPERPPVPETGGSAWPRNEIDRFVLARLREEGMEPSPGADRTTLLRRVTLDLTGLPPTPGEADLFLADRSPDAYEKLVDRLLASPRYGEHMARYWLDGARYADTHGLHFDNIREVWPYRDWVIRAFNGNKPYDRFGTEQLAGDLLPEAALDQQIASGFNRLHVTTNEGGTIPEEFYVRNVVDRVVTAGTVFMGLTLDCTRCHDHKYDPLTMDDFYRMFAFFNSLDEDPMDGNRKDHAPVVKVPWPKQVKELERVDLALADVEREMTRPVAELDAGQAKWAADLEDRLRNQWEILDPVETRTRGGASVTPGEGRVVQAEGEEIVYEIAYRTARTGLRAIRLEAIFPTGLDPASFALGELDVEVAPGGRPTEARKIEFSDAAADRGRAAAAIDGKRETAWEILGGKGATAIFTASGPFGIAEGADVKVRLRPFSTAFRCTFRLSVSSDEDLLPARLAVEPDGWYSIGPFPFGSAQEAFQAVAAPENEILLDKTYEQARWVKRSWIDGRPQELHGNNCATYMYRAIHSPNDREVTLSLGSDDTLTVWVNGEKVLSKEVYRGVEPDSDRIRVRLKAGENALLLKVCNNQGGLYGFYFKLEDPQEGAILPSVARALQGKRSPEKAAEIRRDYRRRFWGEWDALLSRHAAIRQERLDIEQYVPVTFVSRELPTPREAFILDRGEYDQKKEKVERGTPAMLPPMREDLPRNRVGLAAWVFDPGQPLTARVAVNRFWQQCFGTGIVKTSENFGSQGEVPSHPELLDHLAMRFIEDGWDVKKFMRSLVTSATYRQSSRVTPERVKRDPENRLLSRGPRFRLDAEMVRDQALAASGLLVEHLGGPSVKPPQPGGLWEAVAYVGSNTMTFVKDIGHEKVHRRSLYTFWKRTSVAPQMDTLDAPNRESCRVRRERTNTPLQALLLMNDVQFIEPARALAARTMREAGPAPEDRAAYMFRRVAIRKPDGPDVEDLVGEYRYHRAAFAARPEEAKKLVALGEDGPDPSLDEVDLAAWTMVGNLILNLDEILTKG